MSERDKLRLTKSGEAADRWRVFHQTVAETRAAFDDVAPDDLQKLIDEAEGEVRSERYRRRTEHC